ncbi:MAG: bifunctional folylpolyglutamate synthase/dihydrofolate synthase, partial [Microbacteriaceae bacterium]|nr:bifunctional folylpolyglutamate synthase/dihydrofolate synthase [Microbacteriaceae bacterium]
MRHVMAGGSADRTDPPPSPEREALAWLYGFSDWERGLGWSKDAAPEEQWMLGRTRALLDLAGAPDRALRIVHVAGTKGKGSTIAYLESIVQAAGWRSGAYTQPHLHEFRERIRLDGQPIPSEAFTRGVDRLHGLVGPLGQQHPEAGAPTTFELTTVLATLAFAEAGVDVALMEVGLGGRLDATNALDTDLAVITPIGLDHRQILGNTLAKIAAEKAAIIRPGQRVLSARQRPSAAGVIARRCAEVDATFRVVDPLRATRGLPPGVHGRLTTGKLFRAALGLAAGLHAAGRHQRQNAGLAVAAAEALAADGLPLTVEAVERGLAEAWL